MRVVREILVQRRGRPHMLVDPALVIRVNELGESSVKFVARPWVRAEDYWDVHWNLTRQVKQAFDARGLTIPFPQTEMTIRGPKNPGGSGAPAPFGATG